MPVTRIFKVDYRSIEKYNGKDGQALSESKNIKAKDAADAIQKVRKVVDKPSFYIDEETKKKVSVTRHSFEPINVTLEAEAY